MKLTGKTKHPCLAAIYFIIGCGLFYEPAVAAASGVADIYLKVENFTWKEFDESGSRLLEESGPIYGLGVSAKSDMNYAFTIKFKGELFGGRIDYDGQTQSGVPVKTDTDYFGFKIEGDVGRKFTVANNFFLEPFAGLGYRRWSRDLKSTNTAFGYEEKWWNFYGRLGMHGELIFTDRLTAFADGGIKLPIRNENKADLSKFGLSTVTVEPGNKASYFAEAGLKWKILKVSLCYEGLRFSKSDAVEIFNVVAVYQPESKADIFGINIGLTF